MGELGLCIVGCSLTLLAEHIGLWNTPWRLSPPASYAIGVGTLAGWYALWCVLMGDYLIFAVAFLFLAAGSGAWIVLAYWLRERLDILKQRSRNAGRAESNPPAIAPFAPYLTQDPIDRGGAHGPYPPERRN